MLTTITLYRLQSIEKGRELDLCSNRVDSVDIVFNQILYCDCTTLSGIAFYENCMSRNTGIVPSISLKPVRQQALISYCSFRFLQLHHFAKICVVNLSDYFILNFRYVVSLNNDACQGFIESLFELNTILTRIERNFRQFQRRCFKHFLLGNNRSSSNWRFP